MCCFWVSNFKQALTVGFFSPDALRSLNQHLPHDGSKRLGGEAQQNSLEVGGICG